MVALMRLRMTLHVHCPFCLTLASYLYACWLTLKFGVPYLTLPIRPLALFNSKLFFSYQPFKHFFRFTVRSQIFLVSRNKLFYSKVIDILIYIYKEPTWCNLAVCLLVTAIILYMSYTQYDLVRKPSTLDALIGYFTPSHVIHQRLLLQFLSAPEDGRKKRPKQLHLLIKILPSCITLVLYIYYLMMHGNSNIKLIDMLLHYLVKNLLLLRQFDHLNSRNNVGYISE